MVLNLNSTDLTSPLESLLYLHLKGAYSLKRLWKSANCANVNMSNRSLLKCANLGERLI